MKITQIIGSRGCGGAQKAAAMFAAALQSRGHQVDFVCAEDGVWWDHVRAAGCVVHVLPWTADAFRDYLKHHAPDVIHQHVSGMPVYNPLHDTFLRRPVGKRPKLVETSIFAVVSPQRCPLETYRLFVSKTSYLQAQARVGRRVKNSKKQRYSVLINPQDMMPQASWAERCLARGTYGLSDEQVLFIRLGRPAEEKWSNWECRAFQRAYQQNPRLRLLLIQPPPRLQDKIKQGAFGPGILVEAFQDQAACVQTMYAAADAMVHASYFGESFGYTLAEAMASKLPCVVRTTPFGDNAQVELVEHGQTGFVCADITDMAAAMLELASRPEQRRQMGTEGALRIQTLASLQHETNILEAVFNFVLTGKTAPILNARQEEVERYAHDYRRRCWNTYARTHQGRMALGAKGYSHYRLLRTRLKTIQTTVTHFRQRKGAP